MTRRLFGVKSLVQKRLIANLFLGLFILTAISFEPVAAAGRNAVALLYFNGEGQDNAVLLSWATATEINTAGYQIERADTVVGPYYNLNEVGFIPSQADDPFSGSTYSRLDEDGLVNGKTYYYILVEVEVNGTENRSEPLEVNAGIQAENNQIATATQSSSASATSQSPPTQTSQAGNVTPTPSSSATSIQNSPSPTTAPFANLGAYPISDARQRNTAIGDQDSTSLTQSQSAGNYALTPTFESYPGVRPPVSGENLGQGQSYPGPTVVLGIQVDSPYPIDQENPEQAQPLPVVPDETPIPIGAEITNGGQQPENLAQGQQSATSTLVLWVGFLASLALFIASVAGSIYLFSNRKMRDRS